MAHARILMIVPTLGTRIDFLRQSLESISSQDVPVDIVMVCPPSAADARSLAEEFEATVVDDPGSLARAINAGAAQFQPHHDFISWLGDDDLLEPGSLAATVSSLDEHPEAIVAFGACRYVTEHNELIWISQTGAWAPRLLSWGPDLVPQPGMLVRLDAWRAVGGLNESLLVAFDLDLLLKLRRVGPLVYTNTVVSSFRWHETSLTVSDRTRSLDESIAVRRAHLSPLASRFRWCWEKPVRLATLMAVRRMEIRSRHLNEAA